MERQAGVRKFKFDINTGHGSARIKDKDKVDLPKIRKATKSAGFKLFSLDLELTGQVRRVKGTDKALAMTSDGNGRYCVLNPYLGGLLTIAEAARNLVCSGAGGA